jgi:hypothetical protein
MTDQKIDILFSTVEKINKRLGSIEAMMKATTKKINDIEESLESSGDDSEWEGFGPKPEQQPFNPNAETYTLELGHGPYTIRRGDDEDDKTWAGRKKHLMNQRVGFLNSSGVVGTPEQEAYLKETYDRLTAHGR